MDPSKLIEELSLSRASVKGTELTCSCPFSQNHKHGDSNPSFGISLDKEVCHCFGCGWSGSVISLYCEVLGIGRSEAAHMVYGNISPAEMARMLSGDQEREPEERPVLKDRWSGWHEYWGERGFSKETVGRWGLGFDPEENRVTVPIRHKGDVVGYTKRSLDGSQPKWKNTKGFDKRNYLFGLDERKGGRCVLVEAPLSAIKLWQEGVRGAVASFGCSLSEEQSLLIRSNFDECLIWYDPDDAGRNGALKAVRMLEPFMPVFVVISSSDDPCAVSEEEALLLCDDSSKFGDRVVPSFYIREKNGRRWR